MGVFFAVVAGAVGAAPDALVDAAGVLDVATADGGGGAIVVMAALADGNATTAELGAATAAASAPGGFDPALATK